MCVEKKKSTTSPAKVGQWMIDSGYPIWFTLRFMSDFTGLWYEYKSNLPAEYIK